MAAVTGLKLQLGTGTSDGTITAYWSFAKSHLDHYSVVFYYRTDNKYKSGKNKGNYIWYDGTSTTTTRKLASWDIPDGAYAVKVTVKPVAKTHSVKSGKTTKEVSYWSGSSKTVSKSVKSETLTPEVPSIPSISLTDSGKIRAEVTVNDDNTNYIDFYLYRPEQKNTKEGSNTTRSSVNSDGVAAANFSVKYAGYTYKVKARAVRDSASKYVSAYSNYSDSIVTTPGTPSAPQAILVDDVNSIIRVTVTAVAGAETYTIQYTNRKGVWSGEGVSEATIEKGYKSIDISVESGKQYWVRAKAVNKDGVEGSYGSATEVIVGQAPQPPTTWSDRVTAKVGQAVMLYWIHNTVDGSAQQLAQVEITVNSPIASSGGTSSTTTTVNVTPELDSSTGENSNKGEYSLNTSSYSDQSQILWRVRTRGIFSTWSDWSTQREIKVYTPPTLELNVYQSSDSLDSPVDTVESFPFYVVAESGPLTQKAIGFYISITSNSTYSYVAADGTNQTINNGEEVYSEFFDFSSDLETVEFGDYAIVKDNILTLTLSANNIDLEEGIEYTINSSVSMNTGLDASADGSFIVGWKDEAYEPDCEFIYDEDSLTMSIIPYCNEPANFDPSQDYPDNYDYQYKLVEGVVLSVYRRESNGELTLVDNNITNDGATAVSDPHPSLREGLYRIIATTTLTGAVAYYDPPGYPIYETDIVMQWDEDWGDLSADEVIDQDTGETELNTGMEPGWSGSILRLPYNIDTSESTSPDVSLIKPIGRKRPVSHYGTQLGESATWNTEFDKSDIDTINLLRRLQIWTGDVYVREPSGTGYWANVNVSFNLTHCELVVPVTIDITRVEGGL